jgi:hypothetical protein
VASAPAGFFHALKPPHIAALLAIVAQSERGSTIVDDDPAGRDENAPEDPRKHLASWREVVTLITPTAAWLTDHNSSVNKILADSTVGDARAASPIAVTATRTTMPRTEN